MVRGEKNSACGAWREGRCTQREGRLFETVTDLQGLDQARLISAKNLYLLPKNVKESVDFA